MLEVCSVVLELVLIKLILDKKCSCFKDQSAHGLSLSGDCKQLEWVQVALQEGQESQFSHTPCSEQLERLHPITSCTAADVFNGVFFLAVGF